MRFLKLSIAIAALTLTPFISTAQKASGNHEKGHHIKMMKELNLSAEQTKQLKEINTKNQQDKKAIKAKMEPLKVELKKLKTEKKALQEARKKNIEAVLTPEQLLKFNELKSQRKEKGKKDGKKK